MAEKVVLDVEIETGGSQKSLSDLEKEVKSLNSQLKEVPIGSEAFKELAQDINDANEEIMKANESMQTLSGDELADQFASLGGSVGEAIGGFALLGGEGGALQETIGNIENAIGTAMAFKGTFDSLNASRKIFNDIIKKSSILTAINTKATKIATVVQKLFTGSVNTTTKGFKLLRGAIIATGIGALVVAVGLLIANFDKLKKIISTTTEEQKLFADITNQATQNITNELSAVDKLQKIINDETISRKEKNIAILELQKEYPDLLSNIDAEKNSIEDINKALELNTELLKIKAKQDAISQIRAEEYKKIVELQTEAEAGQNVGLEAILESMDGHNTLQGTANEITNRGIKEIEGQISALDKLDNELREQIKLLKEQGATLNENAEAERLAEEAAELARQQAEQERIRRAKEREAQRLAEQKAKEAEREADKKRRSEMQKVQIKGNEETKRELVEIEKTTNQKLLELYGADILAYEQAQEQKKQAQLAAQNATFDLAQSGVNALLELNDAFAGETEAQQKKAFERRKKLEIAGALISSAQGVVNILGAKSTIPQPFSTAFKVAQIGVLLATTVAQIAKIKQQQFSGGGSVASPNVGGGGIPTISPVTNTSTLVPQEPTQVFVTETDISNTQNKVNVIEAQATIQ